MKRIASFLIAVPLAILLVAQCAFAATIIPTPIHTPAGSGIGPGVIVARSFPGVLPANKTLIRGRDVYGVQEYILTDDRGITWQWNGSHLTVYYGVPLRVAMFPITNPTPGWKFVLAVSGGGPEPIYAGTWAAGYLFNMSTKSTLLIPESYASGVIDLPATSVRHVLFRYEEVLP